MTKTILIVEDDELLSNLEKDKLVKEGYQVLTAANSTTTWEILNSNKPIDLIILDLMLPEVDGFSILEKLRSEGSTRNIPVLVFSNLAEDKDIDKAKNFKIKEYMVKASVNLSDLVDKVKSILG
jgi:DNA-binding response OmpR family regulator